MRDVDIGLLSSERELSEEQGRGLLALLHTQWPSAFPEAVGNSEPLETLDGSSIDKVMEYWGVPLLWRHRKPPLEASLWTGLRASHSALYFSVAARHLRFEDAARFLRAAAGLLRTDLAYINILDARVDPRARETRLRVMPFRRGITTEDLMGGIPDLPWACLFGPAYRSLLNLCEVATRIPIVIEDRGLGMIWLQLTEKPPRTEEDHDRLGQIREELKGVLGAQVFASGERDTERVVPAFRFE